MTIVRHPPSLSMTAILRLENTEEGNTWFSHPGEPDIQLHTDRQVWVALGRPDEIVVEIRPVGSG